MLNKKINEIMAKGDAIPTVSQNQLFREALEEMTKKHLGGVAIVNEKKQIRGIISDGDVKRIIQETDDSLPQLFMRDASELMVKDPLTVPSTSTVREVLESMHQKSIWCMPVVDEGILVGFFQMHTIIEELLNDPKFVKE